MDGDRPDPPPGAEGPIPPAYRHATRRLARVLVGTAVVAAAAALVVLGVDILLAAFGGLLFAVVLRAGTDGVKRLVPMRDGLALTLVCAVLFGALAGLGVLLGPRIGEQAAQMAQQFPAVIEEARASLEETTWGPWALDLVEGGEPGEAMAWIGGFLGTFTDLGTYALTGFFVGLFGAANPSLYREGTAGLFPPHHQQRVREIWDAIGYTLRWWLLGQLLAMVVIGVSTGVVVAAFGLPLALVLGLIVGLLGFIPYLGPFMGAVPVALVAATEGPFVLLLVLFVYTAVQIVEGYVVTPIIQHRMVYLPPVVTIVAQVLLGTVVGMMGIVFATPLAAVGLALHGFYRRDFLGVGEGEEEELEPEPA